MPQRGQMLRGGVCSFQALARRLRVFDFEVFFLGTAIVRSFATASTTLVDWRSDSLAARSPAATCNVIGAQPQSTCGVTNACRQATSVCVTTSVGMPTVFVTQTFTRRERGRRERTNDGRSPCCRSYMEPCLSRCHTSGKGLCSRADRPAQRRVRSSTCPR